ncbi:amino acid ABC transporter permease [Streptomyces marincola]|uniref:Amino acid ABC transporter permease n=1 Tax=Streptomyces marincola TaxID=2878388 RepID=A0A1W7CTT0_9ACTN|nr:amino acid ABC transporter permease [Streptomyces marincola]ARQ68145.1 amino acid ABC transporter permease [Streptomyces marincola]
MSNLSVLYDAPGPRARRRNVSYTVAFLAVLALGSWWLLSRLSEEGELEWAKWEPFFTDSRVWTTYLLPGLQDTLIAAGLSMLIALPLGALLGIGRLSDHWWVRAPAGAIVEFFRAIPVLMLMLFANEAYALWTDVDRSVRPLYAVVTGLVLYNASVLAEVVRAGVLSLPKGQADAARAIGMRKGQTMTFVLLPQAVTAMLPALVSQLVVIVKDTALGGAMLGYSELLRNANLVISNYGNVLASFAVVGAMFIVLNFLLTSLASWLEGRIRRGKRSTGAALSTTMPGGMAVAGDVAGPSVGDLGPSAGGTGQSGGGTGPSGDGPGGVGLNLP